MRNHKILYALMIAGTMAAANVHAQVAVSLIDPTVAPEVCYLKTGLELTEAGDQYKQLSGVALGWGIADSDEGYWFNVQIKGGVPDGTSFVVYVNQEPVGVMTFKDYAAELFLKGGGITPPKGLNPLCAIDLIEVVDAKGQVL